MLKLAIAAPLLALALAPAWAQYPGQYPPGQYPPGQYPPGQYPGGGGISVPGRHKKSQKQGEAAQPTISADGHTVSSDEKKLVVATDDGRWLTMTVTPTTKYKQGANSIPASKIVPRSLVHVEAAEDDEAFLTAVSVELLKDAPPEEAAPTIKSERTAPANGDSDDSPKTMDASNHVDLKQPPPDAPDRPVLRRGKLAETASADDTRTTSSHKADTAVAAKKDDSIDFTIGGETAPVKTKASAQNDLINRTQEWAMSFTEGLPNFVCQQMTTRYMEHSKSEGWQPLDVISAKVIYEDGKEQYKEITVGGRHTNKSMLELGGSTSTGEFASVLMSLFSGQTQAQFKFYQSTTVNKAPAAIYDFKVLLRNSDWTINVGGQMLRPAFSGSVWIDKESAQVRRIEMQADNVPKDFPMQDVESAVDYDEVALGTNKFLLPVHAENLSCERSTTICSKNTIDFRDYHKYSGESTILYGK